MYNQKSFFEKLGPGLLYAGAAVGVSHLVQSTRAGAEYGYALVGAIFLANLFKSTFFEYGPRYAAVTGRSMVQGYAGLGKWAVWIILLLTVATMFTIQAAVTIVTAGLAEQITGIDLPDWLWSAILLIICLLILNLGQYSLLDRLMKIIMITLTVTTLVALVSSFYGSSAPAVAGAVAKSFDWSNNTDIFFLIALMGWMPAPLDISIWHSIWTVAGNRQSGIKNSVADTQFDFNIGYWGTAVLALCFLGLGANLLYGSGVELSGNGAEYAGQLIDMYTNSLGNWAYWVIAIASFTTMFSTTLTCLDAFPRVLSNVTDVLRTGSEAETDNKKMYLGYITLTAAGTVAVLMFFVENMKQMVFIATTASFVTAPVIALFNFMIVSNKKFPEAHRPGILSRSISYAGLFFLTGFSLWFLYKYFG